MTRQPFYNAAQPFVVSRTAVLFAALLLGNLAAAAEKPVEVRADAFRSTRYLTEEEQAAVRKSNVLKGFGEADYAFSIPHTGWYELWVAACDWSTDLLLDGRPLIHTSFASEDWKPQGSAQKVLNLYLSAGDHVLSFRRSWPFGLPYMARFFLKPAQDAASMVRLTPKKDYLVFRRGEEFSLGLQAGRMAAAYDIHLALVDPESKQTVWQEKAQVPAGEGLFERSLRISTDREGTFDLKVSDAEGRAMDRTVQFVVIDTKTPLKRPAKLEKELVQEIDCARQPPDYATAATRVVPASFGAYRESGTRGRFGQQLQADSFAYTLKLPSIQDPYLALIDYPDDDQRTFSIALIERAANPYGPTVGVASGGVYSLSGQLQPHELFFYPREQDPRLMFQNWYPGQRAAAARIRIYRISSGFPALRPAAAGRMVGMWQEEPMRVTGNFGAMPTGNAWPNVVQPVERMAQLSNYIGANLYEPTIAVYQTKLWPSRQLPSFGVETSVLGPSSLKDPLQKDLLRLILLTAEKHRINVVGQLFITPQENLYRYLDRRFGGDGNTKFDPAKPWQIVHRDGKPHLSYFNPVYPAVQDWAADVVRELADRYKDSPALKGVALRLMAWQFAAWQTFPSIHYGYEDYTVALFEKETGVKVPVALAAADRFEQRYRWLMANAYDKWVDWRCEKIYRYHRRLAGILTAARPDLKLYLDCWGPNFAEDYTTSDWEEKGWLGLMRETGLDPGRYRGTPSIVLSEARSYPPAIRVDHGPVVAAQQRAEFFDPQPVRQVAKPAAGGSVSSIHMDAQSMEGEMIEYERLGMQRGLLQNKETIHGAGVLNGAGRHALMRYANAMADGNITWMTDGSHGQVVGQPQFTGEFFAEYRALPEIAMKRLEGSGDPVAVWYGGANKARYFYVVNRTSYPVTASLQFSARPELVRLATADKVPVGGGMPLRLDLQPYQLLTFKNAAPGSYPQRLSVTVGRQVAEDLQRQVRFVENQLAGGGLDGEMKLTSFSPVDVAKAKAKLAEIHADLSAGRYWSARTSLMHPCMQRVYEGVGAEPPGLFYRKASSPSIEKAKENGPDGRKTQTAVAAVSPGEKPRLMFEKIIGDMRGLGMHNLSVAVGDAGAVFLLMEEGRIAVFGPDGGYRKCLEARVTWPTADKYIAAIGGRILMGDYRQDYPWVFSAERQGEAPGRFKTPAMATLDAQGRIYVADRGNGRIQIFDGANHLTPRRIVKLPGGAGPLALALRGTHLAAITDRNSLLLLDLSDGTDRPVASLDIGTGARCVAFGAGESVFVGFNGGPDRYSLRRYEHRAAALVEAGVVAPSYTAKWPNLFPAATPMVAGPQGQIWFATDLQGKLLSLDPRSDTVRERGVPPWRTVAVGFGHDGTLYTVGGSDKDGNSRIGAFRVSDEGLKPLDATAAWPPLCTEPNVTIWGLLPDDNGGVYVRVVEPGWQKGWPALAIKKVSADGTVKPWLDFGPLYAKRRAFGPWACNYSLQFDPQRNIILSALPLQAVYKVARDGTILWEAGAQPQGGADTVEFLAPRGTATDSRGRIWVVDGETQKIYCLSPAGKLLLEHGGSATWDDTRGAGFSQPSGIAAVTLDGVDYLYVGDAGNQRLVKYRIK